MLKTSSQTDRRWRFRLRSLLLVVTVSAVVLALGRTLVRMNRPMPAPLTPIDACQASSDGNLETLKRVLSAGVAVDARSKTGETALFFAVRSGQIGAVDFLIDKGASVNARNSKGATPLHDLALWYNGPTSVPHSGSQVALRLLQAGANVDARDETERTPLHQAAYYGRSELAQILLSHGANTAAVDVDGRRPDQLAIAQSGPDSQIVHVLVKVNSQ